jgi:hypothetical protein
MASLTRKYKTWLQVRSSILVLCEVVVESEAMVMGCFYMVTGVLGSVCLVCGEQSASSSCCMFRFLAGWSRTSLIIWLKPTRARDPLFVKWSSQLPWYWFECCLRQLVGGSWHGAGSLNVLCVTVAVNTSPQSSWFTSGVTCSWQRWAVQSLNQWNLTGPWA